MELEPPHLEPDQFDELVADILDGLPENWSPLLDHINVVVDDEPLDEDLRDGVPAGQDLLGRYRGGSSPVQLLAGGLSGPAVMAPAEIALFQGPLERSSSSLDDLRQLVRDTLVHEIGRFLGMPDEDEDMDDDAYLDDEGTVDAAP